MSSAIFIYKRHTEAVSISAERNYKRNVYRRRRGESRKQGIKTFQIFVIKLLWCIFTASSGWHRRLPDWLQKCGSDIELFLMFTTWCKFTRCWKISYNVLLSTKQGMNPKYSQSRQGRKFLCIRNDNVVQYSPSDVALGSKEQSLCPSYRAQRRLTEVIVRHPWITIW